MDSKKGIADSSQVRSIHYHVMTDQPYTMIDCKTKMSK